MPNQFQPATIDHYMGRIDIDGDCWEWTGYVGPDGYGKAQRNGKRSNAHRVIYCLLVEEIPDDLVLDHLCRNRSCVNPDHMEPVTWAENIRRGVRGNRNTVKSVCMRGHEFDYVTPDGRRQCRTCQRARELKHKQEAAT